MQVQVLFPAPNNDNPNQIFTIGDGFGLLVCFEECNYKDLEIVRFSVSKFGLYINVMKTLQGQGYIQKIYYEYFWGN